jgi:PAS domain S-box-containing protein
MTRILQFRAVNDSAPPDATILFAALEACPVCFAVVEAGRIAYANPAFVEIMGLLHRAEIEGSPLAEFLTEEIALNPARENMRNPAKASGRPQIPSGELMFSRKDGARFPIRIACADLADEEGSLLVITAPPTRQVAEPQNLLESENLAALGRVASGVAHDFNNLLTGILLYCDLLLAGLSSGSPFSGYVREIRRAGEQSAALIRQLLALARNQSPDPSAISWQAVISEMHNLLTRLIGEHIQLVAEFAPDAGQVQMDAARMRQILLNLVLNARDAMPEGGRILLSVKNYEDATGRFPNGLGTVEFSVTDTGCGMDSATRSRAFQPFFTTKNNGHGNGLGLATVHRLVQENHGHIKIQSQPGEGTRVSIHLPRVSPGPLRQQLQPNGFEPNQR